MDWFDGAKLVDLKTGRASGSNRTPSAMGTSTRWLLPAVLAKVINPHVRVYLIVWRSVNRSAVESG